MLETFNFRAILDFLPLFLQGLQGTVLLSLTSLLGAMLVGILACVARISGVRLLSFPAVAFIEIIRSTPLLTQLFFFYFGLPSLGLRLTEQQTGVLALSLNSGGERLQMDTPFRQNKKYDKNLNQKGRTPDHIYIGSQHDLDPPDPGGAQNTQNKTEHGSQYQAQGRNCDRNPQSLDKKRKRVDKIIEIESPHGESGLLVNKSFLPLAGGIFQNKIDRQIKGSGRKKTLGGHKALRGH